MDVTVGETGICVERYRTGRLGPLGRCAVRASSDDLGGEDGREAVGGGHCSGTPALRMPSRNASVQICNWNRAILAMAAAVPIRLGEHVRDIGEKQDFVLECAI